jgi:hypothetical protein
VTFGYDRYATISGVVAMPFPGTIECFQSRVMGERNVSRPWTDEEGSYFYLFCKSFDYSLHLPTPDELLKQGVAEHGDTDHWKTIALSVPGRSNKACRKVAIKCLYSILTRSLISSYKRWLHSLKPNVKKSAWTAEEDKLLIELFMKHGPKWSVFSRQIPGRTDDACSKRYREALDPNLKKEEWTPEEDEKLIEAYNSIGGKWGQVGQRLQRSGLGCRNRSINQYHYWLLSHFFQGGVSWNAKRL